MTTTAPSVDEAFKLTPTSVKSLITGLYEIADRNDVATKRLLVESRFKNGLVWYEKEYIAARLSEILHQDRRVRDVKVEFPFMILKRLDYVTIIVKLHHHSQ